MEVTASLFDGKRSIPVMLEVREGLLRVDGSSGGRGDLAFEGRPVQTRRDRLVNGWRLASGSNKPLRCAFDQVFLESKAESETLVIDPSWGDPPLMIVTHGAARTVLAEWMKGKLHWLRGEEVCCGADSQGFTLIDKMGSTTIATFRWDEVRAIQTYKRDHFAYDVICLGFQRGDGSWVEIWESSDGFLHVGEVLRQVHPGIPERWYSDVMLPTFAAKDTLLYRQGPEWGAWPES